MIERKGETAIAKIFDLRIDKETIIHIFEPVFNSSFTNNSYQERRREQAR